MINSLLVFTSLAGITAWVSVPVIILIVLALIYLILINIMSAQVEKRSNRVRQPPPYMVSSEVQALHNRLLVADLHADALLWKRDLLQTGRTGHVDVPRMLEGNIAFQVFGVVTKSPKGQNFESNSSQSFDNITLLSVLSGWPPRTWGSLFQRALYQARKLEQFANRSEGKLMRVLNQKDLQIFLEHRRAGDRITAGFPCLEGTHALEGKLENLDVLYEAGFRMIGLTHFFDNEAGGSAHGREKGGLTAFGKDVVRRTQELHMVVDLAHSSPRIIDDVLAMTTMPVVASHTGVRGTCDNVRNLSDDHIRGIARTGGVMGIAMFEQAVCECSVDATARAMRYTADLVGVDYVALGCDFDGTVEAPIDYRGMALLTEALLKQGFSEAEIQQIMGWNFMRVLMAVLPE
ncbi:MAG: membrane dipeptidase [Chloroflexi bacterium]|nr:membrane dipeptidase [Chloroflexota bacterium]